MQKRDVEISEAPTEPWKIFAQSREQFSCSGKMKKNFFF
jgi:hypothetical protein